MGQILQNPIYRIQLTASRMSVWVGVLVLITGLSVFQDYLFSEFRNTGFYISESLLYNSIWLFLLPLTFLEIKLLERFHVEDRIRFFSSLLIMSGLFVLLHIIVFTSFFVSISHLIYSPSHRFIRIFKSALSSEFSILTLYYLSLPFLLKFFKTSRDQGIKNDAYLKNFKVKKGLRTLAIPTQTIEVISTDKPYSVIFTDTDSFFDSRPLKDLQVVLNPAEFIRVNRSTIVNKSFIKEVISRKNGDYDAVLHNSKTIRLSRHYRLNWLSLLH